MTARPYTLAVFLLRAAQLGLHMADLDVLERGDVVAMLRELKRDSVEYPELATQEDFDRF